MNHQDDIPKRLLLRDLYRLRRTALEAQRARLRAEQVDQNLKELLLEIERKYGLLGRNAAIDIHSGRIAFQRSDTQIKSNGLQDNTTTKTTPANGGAHEPVTDAHPASP